jgi:hypothetical protein
LIGTYSTMFVASPILIWWKGQTERRRVAKGPVLVDKPAKGRNVAGR